MIIQLMRRSICSALLLCALAATMPSVLYAQKGGDAVLWDRVDIRRRDLFFGPGGRSQIPDVSDITLIREEKGGHSKKFRIKDATGRTWVAKVSDEAQSETAAVRLIYGLGYKTEINYLVPQLYIPGKGTFNNARLELRPDDVDRGKEWKWNDNPFKNTPSMKGLMLMMAFINNWDMKAANNVVLKVNGEKQYAISDLGVSFGKTGSNGLPLFWRIGRSRNKPNDYAASKFITGVKGNKLKVHYNGKNQSLMDDFTVADARWLSNLLNQLSDRQIGDAFRAANYNNDQVVTLVRSVQQRIAQLNGATRDRRVAQGR